MYISQIDGDDGSVAPSMNNPAQVIIDSTSGSKKKPPLTLKSKNPKKKVRHVSEIWDPFTRNEDDPSDNRVVCNCCEKDHANEDDPYESIEA
ncbi:hypothetical protein TorRG33x02_097030, partial [Trema orientale]